MDTLLGGHLHLVDIFLGPVESNELNILKPLLNGHKYLEIVTFYLIFMRISRNF